jgi:hypothetical protein
VSTAFVLTGGGSLGAVQVGMLAALHEHGIEPDLLVGTSAGALNAAGLAGPGTTGHRIDALAALWRQVRRRDVFVAQPRRWLAATIGAAPSLFVDTSLRSLVEAHLGYERLEDARLPVHVVTTDLVTGQGLALTEGPAVDAVLASAAVPGLLPPVQSHLRTLVDGGIGEFDALRHTEAWGAQDIYLLPAGYACAGPALPPLWESPSPRSACSCTASSRPRFASTTALPGFTCFRPCVPCPRPRPTSPKQRACSGAATGSPASGSLTGRPTTPPRTCSRSTGTLRARAATNAVHPQPT